MSDLWKQIPADSLAVLDSYMTDHYLPEIAPTAGIVMTSGDQSVGGVKTFTSNTNFQGVVSLANNVWNNIGDDVVLGDRNIAGTLCIKGVNGRTGIQFYAQDESSANRIYYDTNDDNSLKITHPSAAWGSIVTTSAWNKTSNGYFQFCNGMTINYCTSSFNNGSTWTFSKAFTDTNYAVVISPFGFPSNATSDNNWLAFPLSKSSTSCVLKLYDSDGTAARNGVCQCIAIGYS